jgi:death on curing protein
VKYLRAEQVLFIHSRIIDETGGAHGLRDLGLLRSAVARPMATFDQRDLYPTVFQKAAVLAESLAKNHPFLDGNKRTSVASVALFLRINGYQLQATQKDLVQFAINLATGNLETSKAVVWLRSHSKKVAKRR